MQKKNSYIFYIYRKGTIEDFESRTSLLINSYSKKITRNEMLIEVESIKNTNNFFKVFHDIGKGYCKFIVGIAQTYPDGINWDKICPKE